MAPSEAKQEFLTMLRPWYDLERHAGRRAACVVLAAWDIMELYRDVLRGSVEARRVDPETEHG